MCGQIFKDTLITHASSPLTAQTKIGAGRESSLDVLRAVAALTVAAAHAHVIPMSYGVTGVWLFFALSGYLLTGPMLTPAALRPVWIGSYLLRRVARIYPAWLVLIAVLVFFLNDRRLPNLLDYNAPFSAWFWDHATLRYAESYFWTVKMEMILYFILPALMLVIVPLRHWPRLAAGLLLALAAAADIWLTTDVFAVTLGPELEDPLRLSPFLCGMAARLLYASIEARRYQHAPVLRWMLVGLATVPVVLPFYANFITYRYPVVYGLVFAAVILLTQIIRGGVWEKILREPHLAKLGLWGYGFYLWHFPLLSIATASLAAQGVDSVYAIFVLNVLLATPLAAASYYGIERPAIQASRWLTRKDMPKKGESD